MSRVSSVWVAVALWFGMMPLTAHAELQVETARLGHGVRAWYANNANVPVVHVMLSFQGAGSVSDPAGQAGRAALAANLLTEGAGSLDALAFQQAMEAHAISISAEVDQDRLTIHVHALREHAAKAGELLAMALTQPQFAEADVQRVKMQTASMLARLQESSSYRAQRAFAATAFAGHPYASPTQGTVQNVSSLQPDDLRRYMQTYVARNNLLVTAAGDVDGSVLRDMLQSLVDTLPRSDAGDLPVVKARLHGAGSTLRVPMQVPQSHVLIAGPGMERSDPRYYAYTMLNEVIGGNGLISRLAEAVRQEKGLAYGVSSSPVPLEGAPIWQLTLDTSAATTDEAIATVRSTLAAVRTQGITPRECEDARTHALGSALIQLDGSQPIAAMLMAMRIYDLGEDYLQERSEKFNAVRCKDVNALAKEWLNPAQWTTVIAGAP